MVKHWSVVEFICDNCGELWVEQSFGNSDYSECLEAARKDGWEISDDGKAVCKACKCKATPLAPRKQKAFNLLQTVGARQRMLVQSQQE